MKYLLKLDIDATNFECKSLQEYIKEHELYYKKNGPNRYTFIGDINVIGNLITGYWDDYSLKAYPTRLVHEDYLKVHPLIGKTFKVKGNETLHTIHFNDDETGIHTSSDDGVYVTFDEFLYRIDHDRYIISRDCIKECTALLGKFVFDNIELTAKIDKVQDNHVHVTWSDGVHGRITCEEFVNYLDDKEYELMSDSHMKTKFCDDIQVIVNQMKHLYNAHDQSSIENLMTAFYSLD